MIRLKNIPLFFILITFQIQAQVLNFSPTFEGFKSDPLDMIFIDVDLDSDDDIAMLTNSNTVIFYINDGQGNYSESSFQITVLSQTPDELNQLVKTDQNGDGHDDFIVSSEKSVRIFINNGIFSFISPPSLTLTAYGEKTFKDLEGDGDLDLFVMIEDIYSPLPDTVKIYKNNGSSGFTTSPISINDFSFKTVIFNDYDNDNDIDVSLKTLFSLDNEKNYTYSSGSYSLDTTIQNIPYSISKDYLDFNGDGYLDCRADNKIYLGNSADSLIYNNDIPTYLASFLGTYPYTDFRYLDIDMDNDIDILATTGTTYILVNDGNGIFTRVEAGEIKNIIGSYWDISDVDNDGDFDLFIGGHIYFNTGNLKFKLARPMPLDYSQSNIHPYSYPDHNITPLASLFTFNDIDSDGDKDLLMSGKINDWSNPWHPGYDKIDAFLFENDNSYYTLSELPLKLDGFEKGYTELLDVNNDTIVDILLRPAVNSDTSLAQLYLGHSIGFSNTAVNMPMFRYYTYGDIDNDSDIDFIGVNSNPRSKLLKQTQDSPLQFSFDTLDITSCEAIELSDVDGDNDLDLLVGGGICIVSPSTNDYDTTESRVYLNDGFGNFSEMSNAFPEHLNIQKFIPADLDLDGDIDLITRSQGLNTHVNILINNSLGHFTYDSNVTLPQIPAFYSLGDMDGDLDLDLALLESFDSNSTLRVFLNSEGSFDTEATIPQISDTFYNGVVFLEDLNKDHKPDVFITDMNNKVRMYLNDNCFSTFKYDTIETCNTYISPYTSNVYTNGGIYNDTLLNLNTGGCDSIVKTMLTLHYDYILDSVIESCTEITSPFDNTITWDTSGIYSDSTTTIYGCDSVSTYNFTLHPINTDIVLHPSFFILEALETNATYQWLDCSNGFSPINGATSSTFQVIENGEYAVQLTNNTCTEISPCITVEGISVAEQDFFQVQVYPNPFSDQIYVTFNQSKPKVSVYITDIQSKLVFKDTYFNVSQIKLDGHKLENGIYQITLNDGTYSTTKQIIKHD